MHGNGADSDDDMEMERGLAMTDQGEAGSQVRSRDVSIDQPRCGGGYGSCVEKEHVLTEQDATGPQVISPEPLVGGPSDQALGVGWLSVVLETGLQWP
jgi:hypothetical protein